MPLGLSGVPGVWLVEVVAGSRRLRARISKGGLRLWQRPSVAGQVLTVMDEEWRPVTVCVCTVHQLAKCSGHHKRAAPQQSAYLHTCNDPHLSGSNAVSEHVSAT